MPSDIVPVDVIDAVRSTATEDISVRHFFPSSEPPPDAQQRFVELALGRVVVTTYINDSGETCQSVQGSFVGGTNACVPPEHAACPQYVVGMADGTTTFLGVIPYAASTVELVVDGETVPLQVEQAAGFTFAAATTTVAFPGDFVLHIDGSPVCEGS